MIGVAMWAVGVGMVSNYGGVSGFSLSSVVGTCPGNISSVRNRASLISLENSFEAKNLVSCL